MAQIVRKADVEATACHHQKGETDDDTPDDDVYQDFDAAVAWVRELLFHHNTKIRILDGYWKYPPPAKQISVRRLRISVSRLRICIPSLRMSIPKLGIDIILNFGITFLFIGQKFFLNT